MREAVHRRAVSYIHHPRSHLRRCAGDRVAGRSDVGSLRPGATADVVVLDDGLEIQRVLAAGVDALG